ncbi:TRAP transporter substrate-binding protein [Maribacter sp. 1_MG-2023]|uniref:TRAP transporter substrate-binding protein n=1 Tax=Maribacter sp. 1_MG-2023 TaxID=3062677 RepID=UPI0026E277B4|nr:TRAP transporter substrate-binding protein [Maribacter sp. 1_MG-2023]MDO6472814.1 TRAP transporter substrate-binding protein [Maribacter sp. 1_MG-2023]
MVFKKFRIIFFYCLLINLLGCRTTNQNNFVLKASLLVSEDHSWHKAFIFFGERLKAESNGRLQLETFPSEQLAKEVEAIRMIQTGVLDMTTTSSLLSNWTEIMTFCELPFLLKSPDDVEILMNGPLGKRISQEMQEITGLIPLGYFQAGVRQLTSNRPIKHPDDLQGLILRVPNVPSFVTAWDALGAKTTPMAFSEVFTSLQQGTIDAQENPLALIKVSGFYEVQKYVNLTNHVVSWTYPVIGEKSFNKLPKDLQNIFLKTSKEMIDYHQTLFLENEKKIRKELEAKGMIFVDVDNEAFVQKCGTTMYDILSPEMQIIYNSVKEDLP